MSEPVIKARGVHKRYHALEVLKGVDLDVAAGEVVVMMGPSGSGKSTFLRCLNHLEKIHQGRIEINPDQRLARETVAVMSLPRGPQTVSGVGFERPVMNFLGQRDAGFDDHIR